MEAAYTRPAPARVARVLLAAVAIVLIAWFGLMYRNYRVGLEASQRVISNPGIADTKFADAMDELESAETLDPSTDWSLIRANYLLLRDKAAAAGVARSIVRDEPDNVAGWITLGKASVGRDPAAARQAEAEVRRLNPAPDRPR